MNLQAKLTSIAIGIIILMVGIFVVKKILSTIIFIAFFGIFIYGLVKLLK